MPYIVKSSLDIGGKVVPWSEHEANKLIKEKKEYLKQKETFPEIKDIIVEEIEQVNEQVDEQASEQVQEKRESTAKAFKPNRKNQKAGEK